MITETVTDSIIPGDIRFLGTLYNFWNIYIDNIFPYKYNLGRLNITTYLTMLPMSFNISNKPI